MSDWTPYAVVAKLNGMELQVLSVRRSYRWVNPKHPIPGTPGDYKQRSGRESIVDDVTVLLTVPEVQKILDLANSNKPLVWTHPLLPTLVRGYIENLDIPAEPDLYGYFRSTFTFEESYDSETQTQRQPRPSAQGNRARVQQIFGDLQTDLDGLAPIPTASGNAFTGASGTLSDAFADMDTTWGNVASGDASWRELSQSLDAFAAAGTAFVAAAREVESSIGSVSRDIQAAPLLITEIVGDTVDSLRASGGTVATFVVTEPTDLFGMMLDVGIEINETNIVALMDDNGLTDLFAIPAGTAVAIQVPND